MALKQMRSNHISSIGDSDSYLWTSLALEVCLPSWLCSLASRQAADGVMNLTAAMEERLARLSCTPEDMKKFMLAHPPRDRLVPVSAISSHPVSSCTTHPRATADPPPSSTMGAPLCAGGLLMGSASCCMAAAAKLPGMFALQWLIS